MSDEWQKDRETCERATEGPWTHRYSEAEEQLMEVREIDGGDGCTVCTTEFFSDEAGAIRSSSNAEFIIRARERWLPALDRIAELEAEVRTAYASGWSSALKAAVEAVQTSYNAAFDGDLDDAGFRPSRRVVINAIRAVKMGEEE